MEDSATDVMFAVGAIGNSLSPINLIGDYAQRNTDYINSLGTERTENDFYPPAALPLVRLKSIADDFVEEVPRNYPEPLIPLLQEYQKRSFLDVYFRSSSLRWDQATSLRNLFDPSRADHGEISGVESFIDQELIDYLRAQPVDLERMGWRQFELLAGEFLQRSGYEVTVTSGSNDGGIDVRAVRSDSFLGPDLVIVQAKRLSGANSVGIDSVKALWTDLEQEHATQGLIATTTRLAPNAGDFANARKYRLRTAEGPAVRGWIENLATKRPDL